MEPQRTKPTPAGQERKRILPDSGIASLLQFATQHGERVYEALRTSTDPHKRAEMALWAAGEVGRLSDTATALAKLALTCGEATVEPSAEVVTGLRALATSLRRIEAHLAERADTERTAWPPDWSVRLN